MKKYGLLFMVLTGCTGGIRAQDATGSKWLFSSFNTAGLIKGSESTEFQFQTVNGFRKDHLFLGLGAGIDQYRIAGIPVFADTRFFFGKDSSSFFLYADGGMHYPVKKPPVDRLYTIRYLRGFYSDVGIGYVFGYGKRTGFVLQAGYSYKRATERRSYRVRTPGAPDYESVDEFIYNFNRLVFRLGFRF